MKTKTKAIQWQEAEQALLNVCNRWFTCMGALEKIGLRQKGLADPMSAVSEAYRMVEEYEIHARVWDETQDVDSIMKFVDALDKQLDKVLLSLELSDASK